MCSIEVSFQNPPEHLQPCQEVHEDAKSITTTSNHEVELVKFEYPVIGQFYLDPIATYMEKFFTAEPQYIFGITFVLQDFRGLCCKDHIGNQSLMPFQALVLMLIKTSEKTKLLDRLLDWTHWNFSIT